MYVFLVLTSVFIIPFILTVTFYICILNTLFKVSHNYFLRAALILDEQRNLRPGDDDQSEAGDQGGGGHDPSGQATHRGHIPRARVKVSCTQEKRTSNQIRELGPAEFLPL